MASAFLLTCMVGTSIADIGKEVAVETHLQDGDEFNVSLEQLIAHGQLLFDAVWTGQEGGGRPLSTGTGAPLADPSSPLVFPRNFNRVSAPDANACGGCHNKPRSGGGGDQVANVFVTGQRFDFATFDLSDPLDSTIPLRGALDEFGNPVTLQNISNERNTLGMFGSGFIEMLAREMTADLQAIRDTLGPGDSAALVTKGVSFGTLSRDGAGNWDTSLVEGLPGPSTASSGPGDPPSLVIMPFHQAGAVVSLRQFTNNAMNHHHGMQSTERFGLGTDPDGDGFTNELTRADITATSIFQAQLAVPGRVIPRDKMIEQAVWAGEQLFEDIGCGSCHMPKLPLSPEGRMYSEPNPFNPPGNLQVGDAPPLVIDLTSDKLDQPRLKPNKDGVIMVPAYTDLKLHDITSGPGDPNIEPIDQTASGAAFFAGNSRFLTRKLWGVANEPPFFHHGKFTTLRQAIEAHAGEASASAANWMALPAADKDRIIEFLKSLQVLPKGTKHLIVDENGNPRPWPPKG